MSRSQSTTSICSPARTRRASTPSAATAASAPWRSSMSLMASRVSAMSSTIRTRRPRSSAGRPGGAAGSPAATPAGTSGKRTLTSVPRPMPSLATLTRPWCASVSRFTRARPMPRPACRRRPPSSCCRNMSNRKGRNSAATPSPVSRTRTTAQSSSAVTAIVINPPAGVNLTALARMFLKICCSRSPSASMYSGWGLSTNCRPTSFSTRSRSPPPGRWPPRCSGSGPRDRGRSWRAPRDAVRADRPPASPAAERSVR